jgi:hypothetical protein
MNRQMRRAAKAAARAQRRGVPADECVIVELPREDLTRAKTGPSRGGLRATGTNTRGVNGR